ncbi:hypothetical protein PENSPDRAFT_285465 [Peniophora sp. CONT]|nr:hypothetical protein PENSPDRAFT_285465 [Peniophora sp. CONT]
MPRVLEHICRCVCTTGHWHWAAKSHTIILVARAAACHCFRRTNRMFCTTLFCHGRPGITPTRDCYYRRMNGCCRGRLHCQGSARTTAFPQGPRPTLESKLSAMSLSWDFWYIGRQSRDRMRAIVARNRDCLPIEDCTQGQARQHSSGDCIPKREVWLGT